MTSRSPRGAAHPGNGVIAPFHGERPRNRGVKDTHRPPFSAPSSRRRPSETAIRTASPALTLKSSRPGTTNRSRLRDGVGRYESDRRGPGQGGRARLAQCEPSATQSASPRAVRARRDIIRLSSIRAISPGAMRAQVTSPKRLPGAGARLPQGRGAQRTGDGWGTPGPRPLGRLGLVRVMGRTVRSVLCGQGRAGVDPGRGGRPPPRSRPAGPARGRSRRGERG